MPNSRKILFVIYFSLTFVIAIGDYLFYRTDAMAYVKYATMASLFLIVQLCHKEYIEQKRLVKAYWFMLIADFFLVFSKTLHLDINLNSLGMASFLIAYIIMIMVYVHYLQMGKRQIVSAVLVYGVFGLLVFRLSQGIEGIMLVFAFIFGMILCTMTWMSVCVFFQKSFSKTSRISIAISGILMCICDFGVALSMFDPIFSVGHHPILNHIIWIAYIPGWTILASVVIGNDLYKE
ncbi:MAG: lysoplasmalogenase family protein [Lachnotalea sp.]